MNWYLNKQQDYKYYFEEEMQKKKTKQITECARIFSLSLKEQKKKKDQTIHQIIQANIR